MVYIYKRFTERASSCIWQIEAVGTEGDWNKLVRERIHEREEIKWSQERFEIRTIFAVTCGGIPELAKIRGGSNICELSKADMRKNKSTREFVDYAQMVEMNLILCYSIQFSDLRNVIDQVSTSNWLEQVTVCKHNDERLGHRFQPSATNKGKTAGTVKRIYEDVVQCVILCYNWDEKAYNDRGRFGRSLSWCCL